MAGMQQQQTVDRSRERVSCAAPEVLTQDLAAAGAALAPLLLLLCRRRRRQQHTPATTCLSLPLSPSTTRCLFLLLLSPVGVEYAL